MTARLAVNNRLLATLSGGDDGAGGYLPVTDQDGNPIPDGTAELTGLDADGVELTVAGVTWPLSMGHIGGSVYQVQIPADVFTSARTLYYLRVRFLRGGTKYGEWRVRYIGEHRE